MTIGRNNTNDIFVPDKPVSRKHAEIILKNNTFYIRDLGSRNGTMVDGERVPPGGKPLIDGMKIELGSRTALEFHLHPREKDDGEDVNTLAY